MRYAVEENFLFGGWQNAWSYEDWAGKTIPTTYDTKEDAEAELDYFFEQMKQEVEAGNMEDMPDREDFRIVEVKDE